MIFIKGKMKKRASNQSEASLIENSLSKSALDRSSRSILDEYQKKFDDNQKVLQGYIDLLKELKEGLSKIGDNVEKQYKWLKDKPELIPSTPGGQEQIEDIGEKLCQTMGDDGNGNPGCNVTLEQLCDITCDQAVVDTNCLGYCDLACQTACESVCQDNCESQCQTKVETCPVEWLDSCEATKDDALYMCKDPSQAACDLLVDKCPTLEDVLRECGQCLGVCVGPGEQCPELCDAIGDTSCTEYGQDNWCGLSETTCETVGDKLDCVTLGDYSGNTCYNVGETNCSASGEKYCTESGEKYCWSTGENGCLFPGETKCLFEGEDSYLCETITDGYMCQSSGDGLDTCHQTGEMYCYEVGEAYCHEPGEKFYCFFTKDDICASTVDQLEKCKSAEDTWVMCEQVVVDACGIPFKDCLNSAECPAEFGSAAGCDTQGCEAACNDSCISTCDSNCFKGCDKSCTSYCNTGCEQECNGNCNNVCIDTCDTSCFNGCNKSCLTYCNTGCLQHCNGTCNNECISSCDSSCFSGCDKSCTSYCDTGCEQHCDSNCYKSCNKNCTSYCDTECDSSCFKGCDNECTGYSCNDTCDINYNCTGCDGTAPCMAACIPSSETCSECHGGGRWCTHPVGGV